MVQDLVAPQADSPSEPAHFTPLGSAQPHHPDPRHGLHSLTSIDEIDGGTSLLSLIALLSLSNRG